MTAYVAIARPFRSLVVRNCDTRAVKNGLGEAEVGLEVDDPLDKLAAVDLVLEVFLNRLC